jgi:hypothetical protein
MNEIAPVEGGAIPSALVHRPTGRVVVLFDTWPRIDEYGVAPVFRAVIPEGKRQVGETLYRFVGAQVDEVVTREDIPGEEFKD